MEFIVEENRIYFEQDGRLLAQVTFPQRADGIVEIDHTFVDDSLRGQGIAGMLMQKAADSIRKSGRKAVPTCSYAVRWFEKHPVDADILA